MCLVAFAFEASARFPMVLVANRDEFFARPTAALDWWVAGPGAQPILSGRDLLGGGTWLGLNPAGRLALLTNVRDPALNDPAAPTRGSLVPTWLDGMSSDALRTRSVAAGHNGFNLLAIDFTTGERMHVSNRESRCTALSTGIHGLSNAGLDTPWPKVVALKSALGDAVRHAGSALELANRLFEALTDDRPAPDDALPATGVSLEWERHLSSAFILTPDRRYGTRSSTVVITEASGDGLTTHVLERTHEPQGRNARLRQCTLVDWPPVLAGARATLPAVIEREFESASTGK
jgi:uncharacterized protein with NRDE domain